MKQKCDPSSDKIKKNKTKALYFSFPQRKKDYFTTKQYKAVPLLHVLYPSL